MNDGYSIFWGDTHHNTYQNYVQDPSLNEVIEFASQHLDFYTGAYYTPVFECVPPHEGAGRGKTGPKGGHLSEDTSVTGWRGVHLEDLKDAEKMAQEWTEFQEVTADWNRAGKFVAFPGYEWQGDGHGGDHNVVYKDEGHPIHKVGTITELYECIRGLDAIAIPHHTGYYVGQRAPDWSKCDSSISPFSEIYSIHGCSETDEEWIGLRSNSHMGPGVGGGTYQDALDSGLHLGAICSTDNWTNMPGHWGHGLMACLAKDLSRDRLWEAFLSRRVYGVTGDRIELEFTLNGAQMGSILDHTPKREIKVAVRGCDAIDRIEIVRNGRVIATHCHQGTWDIPQSGTRSRFKLRIEPGWGPYHGELPMEDHLWEGKLSIFEGRIAGWQPCWVTRGQGVPQISGNTANFRMVSTQEYVSQQTQGATVFEVEGDPGAELVVRMNGLEARDSLRSFAEKSRLLWYKDECIEFVKNMTGVEPENSKRGDVYFHMANKVKLHRAIPESGYTASFEIMDDEPLDREIHYRVRVEQRNAQRAWSSPIWVKPEKE